MERTDFVDVWPVRLNMVEEPSSLMAWVIELLSFGRAPLRSPSQFLAMQLDRESAIVLRRILTVTPSSLVAPDLEGSRRELLDRLDAFLISGSWRRRRRRARVAIFTETTLYPRWFIESVASRRTAVMLARVAKMFPAVRSATVIDARYWVLLRLDREDALRIRDFLLLESPSEDAREMTDRYVERLSEMIEVPYSSGGAWS